jgi:uncharacterized protein YbaR (Trm112 family)
MLGFEGDIYFETCPVCNGDKGYMLCLDQDKDITKWIVCVECNGVGFIEHEC